MSGGDVVYEVTDARGIMVKLGLGSPLARAGCAAAVVGGVLWLAGQPKSCFRQDEDDKGMKPFKPLSAEPDATHAHFLLIPLAVAGVVGLCT